MSRCYRGFICGYTLHCHRVSALWPVSCFSLFSTPINNISSSGVSSLPMAHYSVLSTENLQAHRKCSFFPTRTIPDSLPCWLWRLFHTSKQFFMYSSIPTGIWARQASYLRRNGNMRNTDHLICKLSALARKASISQHRGHARI